MSTSKIPKNCKIVYRVDICKLSVSLCRLSDSQLNDSKKKATTHVNLFFENQHLHVPIMIEELPAEIEGFYYFETETEAYHFIRMQIGM